LGSLGQVADALIRARTAAGLTQEALAQRLRLKKQQVQRYEATRYAGVGLDRLQAIADALDMQITGRALLPRTASATRVPGSPHRAEAASMNRATTSRIRSMLPCDEQ
jgi:transcriptional regulator with XRE-family HTH domain